MDVACQYTQHVWTSVAKYTCFPSQFPFDNLGTKIKLFKGVHNPEKSNSNVEGVYIENQAISQTDKVREFPRVIQVSFPNLTHIRISNCSLTKITREDLIGLHELESLDLSINSFTSLPNDLFINKRKLRWIDFSNNQLKSFSSKLLLPIKNSLLSINFTSNPVISENFVKNQSGSFEDFMEKIDEKCTPKVKMHVHHLDKFEKLLTTGLLSDFVIKVGEKEFKVHKNVLAVQSSVFEAMFGNEMQENRSGELDIIDFSISAIEDFLHFLYIGVVKDFINGTELFTLACKYDVPDLKEICENIILENLEDENAMEIFNLGHLHCCDRLKQAAFSQLENVIGINLKKGLIDEPQKLKEILDAMTKLHSLMDDCERS